MTHHDISPDAGVTRQWIIAQEGSRRGYSLPFAFHRLGQLRLYYADIWCRTGRSLLNKGPKEMRALAGRFHSEIPIDRVVSFSPTAIFRRTARRLGYASSSCVALGHSWCNYGEWFGNSVEKHLREVDLNPDQDFFIGYNTNCLEVVEMLRARGMGSVVIQVDPGIVEEELVCAEQDRWPKWSQRQGRLPLSYWNRLRAEWKAAGLVLVNSDWSKAALITQGVPVEKIAVIPIAIDLKRIKVFDRPVGFFGRPLRVLWLGAINLRKGIQYLVEAARLLRNTDIEFKIVGDLEISRAVVASFPDNMKIFGRVTRFETDKLYMESDVFVLPTLSDGFAVTQLEAMGHSLPVITTPNCGRVVTDGVDGFIVPPRDSQALADALSRLHNDRALLGEMSRQALLTVRRFDVPTNALAINTAVTTYRQQVSHLVPKFNIHTSLPMHLSELPYASDLPATISRPNLHPLERPLKLLPKAVVCFSGSRDHYQVALAFEEAGLLEKLVTDLYWNPAKKTWSDRIVRHFPKLSARHTPGLCHRQVVTPTGVMVDSLLMKTLFASRSRQINLDRALGRRARHQSWKSQAALFSYSYYAAEAFAEGEQRPSLRFLFQLHPHPASIRRILQDEMVRVPRFAASLKWEHELGSSQDHFNLLCSESRLANGWVVASSYTASTLAENGVPRDQIHVVPYGVDIDKYPCRTGAPPESAPFRVVWVGSMTQRKGLSYFLEAIRNLPQENLEVLICGQHSVDLKVIKEYGIKSVRIFQNLPTEDLTRLLRSSDLFVLPSLAEGFAHVILEAMSSGLPVLTTASTCAPDVLKDGVHGFMVPIRDAGAIANRIAWGRSHRPELFQMGLAAAAQARIFTWERFRKGIVKAYAEMVEFQQLQVKAKGREVTELCC